MGGPAGSEVIDPETDRGAMGLGHVSEVIAGSEQPSKAGRTKKIILQGVTHKGWAWRDAMRIVVVRVHPLGIRVATRVARLADLVES